jgi:hypothetical protein
VVLFDNDPCSGLLFPIRIELLSESVKNWKKDLKNVVDSQDEIRGIRINFQA